MLGREDSEFQVIVFCTMLRKITWNFSKSTKAFNLENIVQGCLAPSNIHRVNKDFSNYVKD